MSVTKEMLQVKIAELDDKLFISKYLKDRFLYSNDFREIIEAEALRRGIDIESAVSEVTSSDRDGENLKKAVPKIQGFLMVLLIMLGVSALVGFLNIVRYYDSVDSHLILLFNGGNGFFLSNIFPDIIYLGVNIITFILTTISIFLLIGLKKSAKTMIILIMILAIILNVINLIVERSQMAVGGSLIGIVQAIFWWSYLNSSERVKYTLTK